MGIGADDIFVFVDAWKQSAYEGPEVLADLETRMSWVYGRAGYAMLITSATTCFAFVATALSPLVEVQSFGIFAALCLLFTSIREAARPSFGFLRSGGAVSIVVMILYVPSHEYSR